MTPTGVDPNFALGQIQGQEPPGESISIAIVACVGPKVLVSVPGGAWDKKASKRKLPASCLEKPLSLAVAGCTIEDRETALDSQQLTVWLGWLKSEFWERISFELSDPPAVDFICRETGEACFPFGAALLEAAKEKFQVNAGPGTFQDEDRISALEHKFQSLQTGLDELLAHHRGESGYVTASDGWFKPRREQVLQSKAKVAATPPGLGGRLLFRVWTQGQWQQLCRQECQWSSLQPWEKFCRGSPANWRMFRVLQRKR